MHFTEVSKETGRKLRALPNRLTLATVAAAMIASPLILAQRDASAATVSQGVCLDGPSESFSPNLGVGPLSSGTVTINISGNCVAASTAAPILSTQRESITNFNTSYFGGCGIAFIPFGAGEGVLVGGSVELQVFAPQPPDLVQAARVKVMLPDQVCNESFAAGIGAYEQTLLTG